MESAKKEVLPGEGVTMNIIVKNIGASRSPESKMYFYVDSTDESIITDEVNKVDSKFIMELEPQAQITFNKLIVIPPYYKNKVAYITATIPIDESYTKDPTTGNNEKITGIRIADIRTHNRGTYSYDTWVGKPTIKGLKKIRRDKVVPLTITAGNDEDKPLRPGEKIEIYASKINQLDHTATLLTSIDFPMLRARESKDVTLDITLGRQFRKGKIYLFGKANPGCFLVDPNEKNNISQPFSIKLK